MIKPCLVQSLYMEKIMTDKKQNEPKNSDNKDTEVKSEQGFSASVTLTPATPPLSNNKESNNKESRNEKSSGAKKQSVTNKATTSANEKKPAMKSSEKTSMPAKPTKVEKDKQKLSKIAIVALIIALLAIISVTFLYYWHTQQQALAEKNILQQTQQSLAKSEQQIKQLLAQQQTEFSQRLSSDIAKIKKDSQIKIIQLEKIVERLSQNQPSDWLLHEAEYLIRIATRTMWLEHDTSAAINLLRDADLRLKELEDPEFLPLRQLIREDIAQLKLMPNIDSEDTILTLMAMNRQLENLPVKSERIPKNFVTQVELDLSENITDWQENLDKTWQYFADSFIKVSERSGKTEALLSPQFQQNLRENLSLKLQLIQRAASEQKQNIYNQTLNDVQLWLEQYFDMTALENQKFLQSIQALKSEIVSYDYPSTLLSLKAIRKLLTEQPLKPVLDKLEQKINTVQPAVEAPQTEKEPSKSTSEAA